MINKKEKITALLLSLFLGFWTWLYTYQIDRWKFWLNLCLTIVSFGVWAIAAWLWAVIETANRPKSFYSNYHEYSVNASNLLLDEEKYTKVEQYKLGLLLKRISGLTTKIKILRFPLIKFFPPLFLAFLGGLLIFIIFSFIIYLSGLNTLVWIKFDLERWLFDESEFILFLSLPMSLIPFYFLFKNFRILYNEYLNKVIKKIEIDLERYFWDVESNYSDFVKELGGMDSVKDLILNLSSKDKIK